MLAASPDDFILKMFMINVDVSTIKSAIVFRATVI